MRGTALRVVLYAVNGTGVGHVTRLLAIARWIRRYGAALDRDVEIWFITSSEADGLVFAEGFAAFKIPSKTIVAETGIHRTTYLALAKQWIWHTLGLLRPDLFVVDTFPRGSFGELISALDLCRRSAFVYRPVRPSVAERADFQAMLTLYDLIVVPEAETAVLTPEGVADRVVHVGPVVSRERWELLPRDVARERLGVRPDRRCVFVSAGGGGDRSAEERIANVVRSLAADPTLAIVVGTGPLYRGRPFPGVTIVPGAAATFASAFDVAVCAAGYNTFSEMMFAGVPCVFLPQDKLADDQRARAERAVAAGAATMLGADDDPRDAVLAILAKENAAAGARSLVPENGARVAAAELLRLVVPAGEIDRVEATLDDDVFAYVKDREVDALRIGHRLAHGDDGELALSLAARTACVLLQHADAREARGLVDAVVEGMPDADVQQRAFVVVEVCAALGELRFGEGAAARLAAKEGRWKGAAGGEALAREMRADYNESSSSLRSTK